MALSYLETCIILSSFTTNHTTGNHGTNTKSATFQIHVILGTEKLACIFFSVSVARPIFGENQITKHRLPYIKITLILSDKTTETRSSTFV